MSDKLQALSRLLKSYFWPESLKPNVRYVRLHDDHEGTGRGQLSVVIGEDGDAWVDCDGDQPLRFRMPSTGGGRSQYTRTALVILAEAIRMDNEASRRARLEPALLDLQDSDVQRGCVAYARERLAPYFEDGSIPLECPIEEVVANIIQRARAAA